MAKLYYRYGTMGSSKTARLLMDAFEYEQRGQFPLLVKPVIDTRSASGMIESRAGLSSKCLDLLPDYDLYTHVSLLVKGGVDVACVFVDEAQFLNYSQVFGLRRIVDDLSIPVMCYGLKTDFKGMLFEGSKALLELANRFEEVKTICRVEGCRSKAMFNVRHLGDNPVFEGSPVLVGDTNVEQDKEYYVVKCAKHFTEDLISFVNNRKEGKAE